MGIDFGYLAIVISVVLISMTFHEAMHGFASYWLGDDTARLQGRLTLNPIKHIDPFLTILLPVLLAISGAPIFGAAKPVPFNPNNVRGGEWGVALVALAGPLTNFVLAFIIFGVLALSGVSSQSIVGQILATGVAVNLGFCIFNLIPIPPLDGSRVLYALAPEFVRRGMEAVERFGIVIVFAIILFAGPQVSTVLVGVMNFFLSIFGRFFGI
jgi:Zn-dependent protease